LKLNKASTFKDYKVRNYPCEVYLQTDDGLYFKRRQKTKLDRSFPYAYIPFRFQISPCLTISICLQKGFKNVSFIKWCSRNQRT